MQTFVADVSIKPTRLSAGNLTYVNVVCVGGRSAVV